MEVQVQELIDSIKKEGVEAARQEASRIVEEAEKQALEIVNEAEKEAQRKKKEGEEHLKKRQVSAEAAMEQAGRDLLLSTEKRIHELFDRLLDKAIAGSFSPSLFTDLIEEALKHQMAGPGDTIETSKKLYESLTKEVLSSLNEALAEGSEIKPVDTVDSGFRILAKDGSAYVSFTSEDLAGMLSPFLQPELQKILRKASGQD